MYDGKLPCVTFISDSERQPHNPSTTAVGRNTRGRARLVSTGQSMSRSATKDHEPVISCHVIACARTCQCGHGEVGLEQAHEVFAEV